MSQGETNRKSLRSESKIRKQRTEGEKKYSYKNYTVSKYRAAGAILSWPFRAKLMPGGGVSTVPYMPNMPVVLTLCSSHSSSVPQETFKVTVCLWNHLQRNKMRLAGTQKHQKFPIMIMSLWHCQVSSTEAFVTIKSISLQHQIKR